MIRRALIWLALVLVPILCQAAAPSCLPSNVGGTGTTWVANTNKQGMWAGWWCSHTERYIVACTRAQCLGSWAAHRVVTLWLMGPNLDDLFFGADPFSDPALLAVWQPDAAMLEAVRPN